MNTIEVRLRTFPKEVHDELKHLARVTSAVQHRLVTLEEVVEWAVRRGVLVLKEELKHSVGEEMLKG